MKVLIVDDEKRIRDIMKEYGAYASYDTYEAGNGEEAIIMMDQHPDIDILILDIMMPHMDGYTALKEIRKRHRTPVIMLSARSEEYDKLLGFELGIDDYVTKPFSPKELIARMKALYKRSNQKIETDYFVYQNLKIDFLGRMVTINNEEIKLTPKEYELLCYFVQNKGIALSREQLLGKIWGYDFFGDDRTIDTHIKMLRNNLGPYRDFILTIRGMGYKFEIPEE